MSNHQNILESSITYLKGVGPKRAELLKTELRIFLYSDLLYHFPFRYIDKTQFNKIGDLRHNSETVQIKGTLRRLSTQGEGRGKRLVGRLRDETGAIELVWFKGATWVEKALTIGTEYVAFGKINNFRGKLSIPHPEMEAVSLANTKQAATFAPVYSSTDKLNNTGLDSKARRKMMVNLISQITPDDLPETLPDYLVKKFRFPSRFLAIRQIHFPKSQAELDGAIRRLKFEELFFLQLRLLQMRDRRKDSIRGFVFDTVGAHFNDFYKNKLPFELTGAQKRVIKEIRKDMGAGIQMNRLLQGDVGSGKTIVGLLCMLIALDNGYQACMMAPTEILAQQHYTALTEYLEDSPLNVGFLSGSIKGKKRTKLLELLAAGEIHILVGTHALIEDWVVFKNLGMTIIDEQHRFGVAQRAKLWMKSKPYPPHVLVMTATPIPRTLAMTLYGDLDVSVIDELPPGRKEIKTIHQTENHRLKMLGMMKTEIAKGRQIYVVYPLIEESAKLDLLNLEEGFESLSRDFPIDKGYQISVVHGKMKAKDKDFEMQRFIKGETQIMVATTVIEVGVNVPNASVMIIENTERFGLSQLHQLRGRVGRGAEQSFCILMSSFKLSKEARFRIETMVRTNNGFDIAEADLKLRGPGNIEGTQQSGILDFKIANLAQDGRILQVAREVATRILEDDPKLEKKHHAPLKRYMEKHGKKIKLWSRIS